MDRKLAKALKAADFPVTGFQLRHRFYPHEDAPGWSEATRTHGVTITSYELENHLSDITDGYYCPGLSDLIAACGDKFARLNVVKDTWMAESEDAKHVAAGATPEQAVARLWLALNGHGSSFSQSAA